MHMSDALLSPAVGLGFHAASATLLGVTARRAAREDGYEHRLPLMGVLGAFVFAAQMVTFAIPGTGSSGHLAGGMLLAILLGPSAAFLVMASVLAVQALFFADGGLLALGCNVFNLGFWPAFVGIALHRAVRRAWSGPAGAAAAAVAACVLSVEVGAAGVAVQTALSGRTELPLRDLLLWLTTIHLPIGAVEGLVTASLVRAFARWAPDLQPGAPGSTPRVPLLGALAGATLFLGTIAASLASSRPDGLTWSLARVLGGAAAPEHGAGIGRWLHHLQESVALLPGYALPGVERHAGIDLGISVSGVVGSVLVAVLVLVAGYRLLASRRALRPDRPRPPSP